MEEFDVLHFPLIEKAIYLCSSLLERPIPTNNAVHLKPYRPCATSRIVQSKHLQFWARIAQAVQQPITLSLCIEPSTCLCNLMRCTKKRNPVQKFKHVARLSPCTNKKTNRYIA